MKFLTIFLVIASIIYTTRAYPASGNPDDDAELIPNDQQNPSYYPQVPSYPVVPSYPSLPSIPSIPVFPSYPTYPTYPTYSYIPISWTYNILDNFSNFFQGFGNRASSSFSKLPFIKNYWPDVKSNGSTTSTVKIVGDHKFIINETVHIQESEYGHVVVKVKTVNIKPASEEDATEESSEEPTVRPEIDVPNSTEERESGTDETFETDESDESDREPVTEADDRDDIDEGVDIDENSGSLDIGNDISRTAVAFENSELIESTERNEEIIKSISSKLDEKQFEIESLSSETATEKQNEWYDIEIETNNHGTDTSRPLNTFYAVTANENNNNNNNNNDSDEETLMIPVDLSNDIAINQMLADQGAIHNPDAEVFDIHQFGMRAHEDLKVSSPESKETKQDSFDYLPYHHYHHPQTAEQSQSIK